MAHVEFVELRREPLSLKVVTRKHPKGAEQESQHQLVPSRSLTARPWKVTETQ